MRFDKIPEDLKRRVICVATTNEDLLFKTLGERFKSQGISIDTIKRILSEAGVAMSTRPSQSVYMDSRSRKHKLFSKAWKDYKETTLSKSAEQS